METDEDAYEPVASNAQNIERENRGADEEGPRRAERLIYFNPDRVL